MKRKKESEQIRENAHFFFSPPRSHSFSRVHRLPLAPKTAATPEKKANSYAVVTMKVIGKHLHFLVANFKTTILKIYMRCNEIR